jgi:ribosome-binding protein aMBF1 (putative translation factor)
LTYSLNSTQKNLFRVNPIQGFTLAPSDKNSVGNETYKKLRELLIEARKTAGLTQANLSQRLHRPQSFVSKYERGERRLDVIEFGEVAKGLDVDPVKFLAKFYRGNK